MRTFLFIYFSFLTITSVTAQYLANTQALIIKEIEHLYFDAASAGILSAVTPCSNYYDPSTGSSNNNLGRNTAAEWVRTAFRKSLGVYDLVCKYWNSITYLETALLYTTYLALLVNKVKER